MKVYNTNDIRIKLKVVQWIVLNNEIFAICYGKNGDFIKMKLNEISATSDDTELL